MPFALVRYEENHPDNELLTLRALKKNNIRNEVKVAHEGVKAPEFLFGQQLGCRISNPLPEMILLDLKLARIGGRSGLKTIKKAPACGQRDVLIDFFRVNGDHLALGVLGALIGFALLRDLIALSSRILAIESPSMEKNRV
ncbi:MAG TPA: hypothetical protein VGG85_17120 [Terracidiphilus sp.]